MVSLLIWIAILWACFGIGAAGLRRVRAQPETSAEEIPFAIALGLGLLSYLVLALGLLGFIRTWAFIAVICLLGLLGWRHVVRLGREAIAGLRRARWNWAVFPLLLFLVAAAVFTLIGALAPSGDIDYDGLVYHLTIPKIYLQDGRIHPVPWLSHSNFPFTLEMLYLLGLTLRDQSLAKLFHFGCGWLVICAVFAFARRTWGARAGWLGAAILASAPLVAWEMMVAYNELAFALYAFLAIFALSRWAEGRGSAQGNGWLWVAAIMCGLALGTKMLAGAVLVFVALAILAGARDRSREGVARPLLGFLAISTLVAFPWYLKSYLWTGNPVYPFLYEVFGGRYWTDSRAALYTAAQKEFGMGGGPLAFLALPWNLTMNSYRFFDLPSQLRPISVLIWVFGPALLALVPTLLVTRRVGTPGRLVLWFALAYTAIWFAMSPNGRYLLPILPGLCACAGLAASRLLERRGLLSAGAVLVLLLGLLAALYANFSLAAPAWRVIAGAESQSDYLQSTSIAYRTMDAINRATPPDANIIVFGDEPRLFYLDRRFLLGSHAEIFTKADLATPDALLAAFRRQGATHLLIGVSVLQGMTAKKAALETDLAGLEAEGRIRPLGMYGTLSLWELVGGRKPSQP
jgi:hypothetical protein